MSAFESHELDQWLAGAARELQAAGGSQATLDVVCELAVQVITGCRSAGVTEDDAQRRGEVLAASDDTARALHLVQYDVGQGPCLHAIRENDMVWVDDLPEDGRWPRFAEEAAKHGIRSMLAIQLYTLGDTYGALTLFAACPGTFDQVNREVAQSFGAHAAVALAGARENAQLSEALVTRQRIGQATGLLAERHGLTTDEAFAMMVRASSNSNIKLRDLADRFVTSEDDARTNH